MSASVSEFNARMYASEQLVGQLLKTGEDLAMRCVEECAKRYNFDAEEALNMLGLGEGKLKLITEGKKGKSKAEPQRETVKKSAFPLPYNGELNESCCNALRQNNGLYTQCTGEKGKNGNFCKSCANTMQKTGAETPEYGTIQDRLAVGIFEYVDPKGRKPIAYTKVMKKYKISEEQVLEEAGKLNMIINREHFVVVEDAKRGRPASNKEPKVKGVKGRPKKNNKVIEVGGDDDDLFATLVANANESDAEEDAAEKEAKEKAEKEAEKAEKEAKEKAEKAEKEAKKEAEKEAKKAAKEAEKAEKEAKKAAEKEAKKAAEKAAKEAEKEAKKAAKKPSEKKAEKEAKKAAKKPSEKKAEKPVETKAEEPEEEEEEEEADVVKKIMFEGKQYLQSKNTGIVYDYNKHIKEGDQVIVGKWNETTNKIDFTEEDDDDEESEDEYDD